MATGWKRWIEKGLARGGAARFALRQRTQDVALLAYHNFVPDGESVVGDAEAVGVLVDLLLREGLLVQVLLQGLLLLLHDTIVDLLGVCLGQVHSVVHRHSVHDDEALAILAELQEAVVTPVFLGLRVQTVIIFVTVYPVHFQVVLYLSYLLDVLQPLVNSYFGRPVLLAVLGQAILSYLLEL